MENAKREDTRKKLLIEHDNLAREENIPLLEKILPLRDDIAKKLGYKTWADYQTEVKMVKNAATAIEFLEKLKTGLQPKFDAELAEFRKIKGAAKPATPTPKSTSGIGAILRESIEKGEIQRRCRTIARLFPLSARAGRHVQDLSKHLRPEIRGASSRLTNGLAICNFTPSPIRKPASRSGLFYLDMFPREGKYNHFAQFGIIEGKLLPDGKYQRPTVALVCNFPPPGEGQTFADVASGCGNIVSRIRPCDAFDSDPRQIFAVSPAPVCRAISSKPHRRCWRTGSGTKKFWIVSPPTIAIHRRKSRPIFWPNSRKPSWPRKARAIAGSFRLG